MIGKYAKYVLTVFLFLAFFLRYIQVQSEFDRQRTLFPQPEKGKFEAWVSEDPEVLFTHEPGSHDTGRLRGFYEQQAREVRVVCVLLSHNGRPVPAVKARCALLLSPRSPQSILSYGDRVTLEGKLEQPLPPMNPGQFDYPHYLKTKGVPFVFYATPGNWGKADNSPLALPSPARGEGQKGTSDGKKYGWTFLRWSYGLKRSAEEALYRALPFPQNALLDGILLGERSPLPDDLVQSFFLTGTIHILAVSGMITAFLAGLFFTVFRAFQVKRKWAAGLTLAALLFFVFMTGAHPPVCRAGLFSALALLAVLLERRVHGGALLVSTALFLLLLDPFLLEDLSFQISFLATAGLMVMSPWMMKQLSFLWRPAAFLLTATTAAQLAVWVLIIYDFNQFSFYSLLSNLIIVPLALFSAAGGLTLLAGAVIHPALGTFFGAACGAPLRLLMFAADHLARLPKAEWVVASPPLAWVLVYHLLLLYSFYWFWPHPRPEDPSPKWKMRFGIILKYRRLCLGAWALFFAACGAAWAVWAFQTQPFRMIFLSVGHGNAVVLRSPSGHVLIADGGKETRGPDRYNPVVAYLRHEGIQKVDGLLNTHPDEDHVGGLVNVLSAYPVDHVYEGTRPQSDSSIYQAFQEMIVRKKVKQHPLTQGDRVEDLAPGVLEILHPSDRYAPKIHADNNRSLASLVDLGGFHLLLPGDLEKDGLQRMLKDHQPFPWVDWLMAPHHGRKSGEPALCAGGFKPHFVVLSDFRDYPDDHLIFQSMVPGAVVLSTAEEGAIEVELNSKGQGRYRTFQEKVWIPFATAHQKDNLALKH